MPKIDELRPLFCDTIPHDIEPGVLYISLKYRVSIHLCACGCGGKCALKIGADGWAMEQNGDKVTFRPSIGNWLGEDPHHAHYFITDNKIQWA